MCTSSSSVFHWNFPASISAPIWFSPATIFSRSSAVHAHCDLPCGVYDPAQARIEAESVLAITKKYADSLGLPESSKSPYEFCPGS